MKAAQEVDLGKEAVKKLFFMLAIPAILSQLVNALYNMVDRMYIKSRFEYERLARSLVSQMLTRLFKFITGNI